MDLRRLRSFIILAETLNYHKAAERLFVTQPALSKQILMLEEMLGGRLFTRGPYGTELTDFGRSVYLEAKELTVHSETFVQRIQEMSLDSNSTFTIGYTFPLLNLYDVMREFSIKYPLLCIAYINNLTPRQQLLLLEDGSIQVAMIPYPVPAQFSSKKIGAVDLFIVSKYKEINNNKEKSKLYYAEIIDNIKKKLNERINVPKKYFDAVSVFEHASYKSIIKSNDIDVIFQGIIHYDGLALLPEQAFIHLLNKYSSEIIIYPSGLCIDIALVWSPKVKNKAIENFISAFL